ncbi:AraC family transcriptional regulator [Prolixibacteraceae bacterium JC049]|nr:AraC family transcriptional regulator [Prolixibacteraceae bacterium JC049]
MDLKTISLLLKWDNMEFQIGVRTLVDVIILFQGVVFGAILAIEHRKNNNQWLLGLFLLTYAFDSLGIVVEDLGFYETYPWLDYLPINFYLLSFPLLFLYAKATVKELDWKKDYKHMIPGVIEIVGMGALCLIALKKRDFEEHIVFDILILLYGLASIFSTIYYSFRLFFFVRKCMRRVGEYYSNLSGKNIRWIYRIAIYNIFLGISSFALFGVAPEENNFYDILFGLLNLAFVVAVSILAIRQGQFKVEVLDVEESKEEETNELQSEFATLSEHLEETKLYVEADLTLPKLARACGLNQRILSRAIHVHAQMNFNQYINRLRTEEAQLLLKDSANDHLCIEAIGEQAGFNSKATFYTTFKKVTGVSPSVFRNQNDNLQSA